MTGKTSTTPPRRHRRELDAEERALWDAVARSTRPLHGKRRTLIAPQTQADGDTPPAAARPRAARPTSSQPVGPEVVKKPAPPPLAGLHRRERSALARGRKDIDARIDLHGMTQARAHRALRNFLEQASEAGMTFVLVITGKGRSGEGERGVLRRQVPEWLGLAEFRSCVVGFEEAHIGHGGGGALYVRIRRRRAAR